MTESAILEVLKSTGPVGVCLVVAGFALRHIYLRLNEVQEKRVADATAATVKLLELVQQQHAHMGLLARAIDGNTDANVEFRTLLATSFARIDEVVVRLEALQSAGRTTPRVPLTSPTIKR